MTTRQKRQTVPHQNGKQYLGGVRGSDKAKIESAQTRNKNQNQNQKSKEEKKKQKAETKTKIRKK